MNENRINVLKIYIEWFANTSFFVYKFAYMLDIENRIENKNYF